MKKNALILVASLVTLSLMAAPASEKEIATKPHHVTLFANGAQVSRQQTVALDKGETTLRFTGLSPYLTSSSVQVNAKGNLTILSVKAGKNHINEAQKNKDTESLTKRKEAIEKQIAALEIKNSVVDDELKFISSNRRVAGKEGTANMTTIKQANDYYRERAIVLYTSKSANKEAIDSLKRQKAKIEKQIAEAGQSSDQATGEVEVKVYAASAQNAQFDLSYYVGNASWKPVYDLRVKDIASPVALDMKAEVSQNTKEKWENVRLTLSTANPSKGGTAPVLSPWELRDRNEIRVRGGVYRSMKAEPMLMAAKNADTELADFVTEAAAGPRVTTQENATAVEYAIQTNYTLPSGDKNTTVTIGQHTLAAIYEYIAIPKLEKDVFLTARVSDWESLNLQRGKANIFFQNTYVGSTVIDVATTDTLTLSLGRDKGVAVSRVAEEKMTSKKTLSDKVTASRGWKITVKNNKTTAIDLTLRDQLPKSPYSDVVVSEEKLDGASVDKTTGEVSWKLRLNAGESVAKTFGYKVKYPSSRALDIP